MLQFKGGQMKAGSIIHVQLSAVLHGLYSLCSMCHHTIRRQCSVRV